MDKKYLAEIRTRAQEAKAEKQKGNDLDCACLSWAIVLNDIPVLRAEVERLNQQIATLEKALELACERNAEYAFCGGTDAMKVKHAEKNFQHFIQQAQEQEEKK